MGRSCRCELSTAANVCLGSTTDNPDMGRITAVAFYRIGCASQPKHDAIFLGVLTLDGQFIFFALISPYTRQERVRSRVQYGQRLNLRSASFGVRQLRDYELRNCLVADSFSEGYLMRMIPAPASASLHVTNEVALALIREAGKLSGDILDLGAGSGYMSSLLLAAPERVGKKPGEGLHACDIDEKTFSVSGVEFTKYNINKGLPYADASFDAVNAIEVLEHTAAPYHLLNEIKRVLKPGGVLIFSVPNIGHMQSRLSFLFSGHYFMFPSPSTKPENAGRLCGHVAPLAYQYWHYGLRLAGFSNIRLHKDRTKLGAAVFAILFWPFTKLAMALHRRRLARGDPPLYDETSEIAREANCWTALTSRSLVFSAVKTD